MHNICTFLHQPVVFEQMQEKGEGEQPVDQQMEKKCFVDRQKKPLCMIFSGFLGINKTFHLLSWI